MNTTVLAFFVVLATMSETPVEELSLPEPTNLSVLAENSASEVISAKVSATIGQESSMAEVTVVELVAPDGAKTSGIRLSLQNESRVHEVYLDSSQSAQLRDELIGLEEWYINDEPCQAQRRCVRGVARCRPSQTVRQAVCPGFFSTPGGSRGVIVTSAGGSFLFQSVSPEDFAIAIDSALDDLGENRADE